MAERLYVQGNRECLRGLISRQWMPFLLLIAFGFLVANRAQNLNFGEILGAVEQIAPLQWIAALGAAVISFWAVGRMELIIHRVLNTDVPDRVARLSGIASVATAQITGFGLLTGTLARWRILRDASLWQAAKVTVAVCMSFMAALAVLAALMVLWSRPDIAEICPKVGDGLHQAAI